MASVTDLEARIAALEASQIRLKDLPLTALQRKLEQDWQPDAAVLLGQSMPRGGVVALTFTASPISAIATVNHRLGQTPVAVVATALAAPQIPLLNVATLNDTTFQIAGQYAGAYTGIINVCWLAI